MSRIVVYLLGIAGMIHVADVNMTDPANIRYSEILIGSGRLRSYQMMQATHGMCFSGMGLCTATAPTPSLCVASGRP